MKKNWQELLNLIPMKKEDCIDWNILESCFFFSYFEKMKKTMQNPVWHGEGDVFTHTKMVCESLLQDSRYYALEKTKKQIVFLATLLHDIGKIPCTKWEDDHWTSPSHTAVGAKMARELLWKEYGVCGTKQLQNIRECICTLIRYHSVPSHLLEQSNPEKRLLKIAAQGELIPDFSLELLQILVEADMKGRISDTKEESLETVRLCFELAKELEVFDKVGIFASNVTKRAYFVGSNVWKEQQLYDNTWGEVILMSGLPGTGKDTWIREQYRNLPVVCLDDIRKELNISPKEKQGAVIQEAKERAKQYLRKKQPFIWNATNITSKNRTSLLELFEKYGASTKIVFLETGWEEELKRNRERKQEVPETVIIEMLKQLELPERWEAREVEWNCI